MRTLRLFLIVSAIVAVAAAIIILTLSRARVTETTVRTIVVDTILREAPETFLITGTLTFSTEVNQVSEKTLLPGVLNLDLGTTVATVRAPGRAAYGFDTSRLLAESIHLRGDTVTIRIPYLEVFAVEPDLSQLERQVEVGWARLYRSSGQEQELLALRRLQPAMRARATDYLRTSDFPRKHSEEAVAALVRPILAAAGLKDTVFRFEHEAPPVDIGPLLNPETRP